MSSLRMQVRAEIVATVLCKIMQWVVLWMLTYHFALLRSLAIA